MAESISSDELDQVVEKVLKPLQNLPQKPTLIQKSFNHNNKTITIIKRNQSLLPLNKTIQFDKRAWRETEGERLKQVKSLSFKNEQSVYEEMIKAMKQQK